MLNVEKPQHANHTHKCVCANVKTPWILRLRKGRRKVLNVNTGAVVAQKIWELVPKISKGHTMNVYMYKEAQVPKPHSKLESQHEREGARFIRD
jgi:hypothetical protein